jgi:hypothetical protein
LGKAAAFAACLQRLEQLHSFHAVTEVIQAKTETIDSVVDPSHEVLLLKVGGAGVIMVACFPP